MFKARKLAAVEGKPAADLPSAREQNTSELTLSDVHEGYAKLVVKRAELMAREEEIFQELRQIVKLNPNNRRSIARGIIPADHPYAPKPVTDHPAAVKEKLGELTPEFEPPGSVIHVDPLTQRTLDLNAEHEAIQAALSLLVEPTRRAYREACKALCEIVEPEYKIIAAQFCQALVLFGHAKAAHDRFAERMKNVEWGWLRPIETPYDFDPMDPGSTLRRLLTAAAEGGHFNLRDDLPAEWKVKK